VPSHPIRVTMTLTGHILSPRAGGAKITQSFGAEQHATRSLVSRSH